MIRWLATELSTDEYIRAIAPLLQRIREELDSIRQAVWLICSALIVLIIILVLHFQFPGWKGFLFE